MNKEAGPIGTKNFLGSGGRWYGPSREVFVGVGWLGLGAGCRAGPGQTGKDTEERSQPAGPASVFLGPRDRLLPNLSDNPWHPTFCVLHLDFYSKHKYPREGPGPCEWKKMA